MFDKTRRKVREFWDNHKDTIALVTLGTAAAVVCGITYDKVYKCGVMDGAVIGANATVDFLDEKFPEESHARDLWNRYAEENPDKMVYRKGLGKWGPK